MDNGGWQDYDPNTGKPGTIPETHMAYPPEPEPPTPVPTPWWQMPIPGFLLPIMVLPPWEYFKNLLPPKYGPGTEIASQPCQGYIPTSETVSLNQAPGTQIASAPYEDNIPTWETTALTDAAIWHNPETIPEYYVELSAGEYQLEDSLNA